MNTVIEKFIGLQKEILSNFALKCDREKSNTSFREDVQKYFCLENKFGWNIMLNSYYVINDTELAKTSFNKFGLQGPSRYTDIGERYLRLYGLLNSIYQQKIAVVNLIEIFKLPNPKELTENLKQSVVILLRNKIASHPSNYSIIKENSEHKFDVYEIVRADLQSDKITLLRNQNDFEYYDLPKSIKAFDNILEEILDKITSKIIKKIFNNNGKYYDELVKINLIRDGFMIIGNSIIKFD